MKILVLPSIKGHNLKNKNVNTAYTTAQIEAMQKTSESAKKLNPKKVAVRSRTKKNIFL